MRPLDALDARILLALDADPEATILSLSRLLGAARNTVHARLRRLADEGALGVPSRRLSGEALGLPVTAFVSIAVSQASSDGAVEALQEIAEIVELHATTGDADYLAKVVARDPRDLHRVTGAMLAIDGVERTSTALSLVEVMPPRLHPLLERIVEDRPGPVADRPGRAGARITGSGSAESRSTGSGSTGSGGGCAERPVSR